MVQNTPKCILGRGEKIGHVSVLDSLLVKSNFFILKYFAVSNMDICFIKEIILMSDYGHFLQNFTSHGLSCPPPHLPQHYLGLDNL